MHSFTQIKPMRTESLYTRIKAQVTAMLAQRFAYQPAQHGLAYPPRPPRRIRDQIIHIQIAPARKAFEHPVTGNAAHPPPVQCGEHPIAGFFLSANARDKSVTPQMWPKLDHHVKASLNLLISRYFSDLHSHSRISDSRQRGCGPCWRQTRVDLVPIESPSSSALRPPPAPNL